MARHSKTIKKLEEQRRGIRKDTRGGGYDRVDLREEVMTRSPTVLALMRGQQRRVDGDFGKNVVAAEPLLAIELLALTFDRHDFDGGGDNGVRMVLSTGLVEAFGITAGDQVELREGEYEGRTLTVESVDSSLDEVRFTDDVSKSPETNISASVRLSSNA